MTQPNSEQTDPGLFTVMENMSVGMPNPFRTYPKFEKKEDDPSLEDGLTIVFNKATAEQMTSIAKELGFDNLGNFVNASVSIYGQMLRAAQEDGYTKALLLNPETEEVISVTLVDDGL